MQAPGIIGAKSWLRSQVMGPRIIPSVSVSRAAARVIAVIRGIECPRLRFVFRVGVNTILRRVMRCVGLFQQCS
jgi:hypothetical protein